ncbi:hypothetical protein ACFQE0_08470 [Methylobacterium komagatae]|uniref:ATPase AAA-type core domain-containing protein n=1 Tax=Methylobacterium komagatae TaxID=374425 RepID=A0ABW2BGX3_9HYPH
MNGFLECLDGDGGRAGVLMIGATNDATQIDPAILRAGRSRSGDRDRPARPRGTARHPAPPSRIGSRRLRSSAHCPKGVGRNRRRLRRLGAARQRPGPPRRTASRRERYPRGDRRLSRTRTSRGRETGGDPRMRACRSRAVARPVDRRSGPALARTRGAATWALRPPGS